MLFKILHGDESNISLDVTPFHEGWCYVTHSGYFYVDLNVGTTESPNNQRLKLNASNAETLTGMTLEQIQKSISWNNLLDRPFGYETEVETPLTEERTFTDWCRLTNATGTWSTLSQAHSDGCIVKVYYDDEVYLCTAETGGSGFILVSDTELPFTATEAVAGSDGSVKFTALDGGTHTVLITRVDAEVVKVPEEYIPDTIARISDFITNEAIDAICEANIEEVSLDGGLF